MTYRFSAFLALVFICLASCSGKKTSSTNESVKADTTTTTGTRLSVTDSIEATIAAYEPRLDIKMKRKVYEPRQGVLVTLQKWFEFGDTTRLLKLREEILTDATRMQIIQYHFINSRVAEIREYDFNKRCPDLTKQCIAETNYFLAADTLYRALHRSTTGTPEYPPMIESQAFQAFKAPKVDLPARLERMNQINKKYAGLPFPKPRPEKGTPTR